MTNLSGYWHNTVDDVGSGFSLWTKKGIRGKLKEVACPVGGIFLGLSLVVFCRSMRIIQSVPNVFVPRWVNGYNVKPT